MKFVKREMFRGDSLSFDLTLTDPSTGGPLNLTGAKIWFTAKNNYVDQDASAVIAINSADVSDRGTVTITDIPRGLARVDLAPLATRAFPDGIVKLVYDVQVKDGTGYVTTVESGTIDVYPDVSRAIV